MAQERLDRGPLEFAAEYARRYRGRARQLHSEAGAEALRRQFCRPLPDGPRDEVAVLNDLIAAAEPGLVGNTGAGFFAWVMGGSSPVGVAADWLTAAWGQNAAIYQTSPAAAVAEEAVSAWMLELLDLPRTASVGLVTGATMAAFVGLAAARTATLARAGHDFEAHGLQNAPHIRVFLSEDAHVTNRTAIRHIGLGDANCVSIASDDQGRMRVSTLAEALAAHEGPKIIISQAGQINSGAFEDFKAIAALARQHDAWHHVDGAFGLWARVSPARAGLVDGIDLADSWSVDGHKWLQIPYDSGFAIVRDPDAHRRAMDISASYLNANPDDGRNPTQFSPELSRRARGFAAWAVLNALGRSGVRALVENHCTCARMVADRIARISGLRILNDVQLNQIAVAASPDCGADAIASLAEKLNATGEMFVRTAQWKGTAILRISIISNDTSPIDAERLSASIEQCWRDVSAGA